MRTIKRADYHEQMFCEDYKEYINASCTLEDYLNPISIQEHARITLENMEYGLNQLFDIEDEDRIRFSDLTDEEKILVNNFIEYLEYEDTDEREITLAYDASVLAPQDIDLSMNDFIAVANNRFIEFCTLDEFNAKYKDNDLVVFSKNCVFSSEC